MYARNVLLDELAMAVDDLPADPAGSVRGARIGRPELQEIASETGVNVNTLLSRKRYAVLRLHASDCKASTTN